MTDKFTIKELEDITDMAEAIEELGHKVIHEDDPDVPEDFPRRVRLIMRDSYDAIDSVATQHFLMAYAQLRAAEASMKLCVQHYHLEIDKQIAKKIRAGNIPTQYRGMTAKQIFAAMENES